MTTYLFTGLGATSALFEDYDLPGRVKRVEYLLPPNQECSFSDYARLLIEEYGIREGDHLLGVSLGGMMAGEIAKHVRIAKMTLISSCTSVTQLHPWLRRSSFLAPYLPWSLFRRMVFSPPGLSETRRLAVKMFREADSVFVRWACCRVPHWDGALDHADLMRIHGSCDLVFPLSLQKVEMIIPGGDHLMILNRRSELQPLLAERIQVG